HNEMGKQSHVVLPAAISGEMNLTSMNGERRMRLVERYMDPPGSARPDCMIAAGIARAMQQAMQDLGQPDLAEKFTGYDWQDEGDAFEDGYRKHANGGEHVTYDR